ncbi:SDR family NAD(P)-dependent oxidoreductase [Chloroflexota bacterium]
MKLTGKVAIVTGSARGLGKAIATKFASEGAAVVVSDILIEQAQQTADEIKKQGGTAIALKTDVSNKADTQKLAEDTLKNFKAVHILVNNAGFAPPMAGILEIKDEVWDAVMGVMLKGVLNCTQAVFGHMMEQRYGKIINISSIAGFSASARGVVYSVAKAGVIQMTKSNAMEAGPYGINVNSIAPAFAVTDFQRDAFGSEEALKKAIEGAKEKAALRRIGEPEDIADLALFLASEDSRHITGQIIRCDGGRHDLM